MTTESRSLAIFRHRRSYDRIPVSIRCFFVLFFWEGFIWLNCRVNKVWLTRAAEGPSSTVKVHHPSLAPLAPHRLENSGGHASERGVGHTHGRAGASPDLLHPGHHPVQHVDPVANTQRMSHVALETQTGAWKADNTFTRVQEQVDHCDTDQPIGKGVNSKTTTTPNL